MIRFVCIIGALLLASCTFVQNPEKELSYNINSLSTRLTPAPEFRGAGMSLEGNATILEGSLSYRKEMDTPKVKKKMTRDLKDNYEQRLDLGNPPVEGSFSVAEKSGALLIKFTAGVDENLFLGLTLGANTKFFEAGAFVFDRMGSRTYNFDGTVTERTTYYAGNEDSFLSVCFWDKKFCQIDSIVEKSYPAQYEEYLVTHQVGAGLFFSFFLNDLVLEYSGSFYSSAITEDPNIKGIDFENRAPVVTTQRISIGYNITPNIAARSGAIYTSGSSFDGSYWAFFAGLSLRLFL